MAIKRWTGAAADVRQVDLFTFGGTFAGGETTALVCNHKRLEVTSDATDFATTDMAAYFAAAINANAATLGLVSSESRNFGGQEIPEFRDVKAYASGSVCYVESRVPGVPFTITADDSGSTSGTITRTTGGSGASVAATGRNWITNADNFEGGSALVDGDDLVCDIPAPDILFGFADMTATEVGLFRRIGFKSNIGLLPWNPGGYWEYRDPNLVLDYDSVSPGDSAHYIESDQGYTFLNLGAEDPSSRCDIVVMKTRPASTEGPGLRIVGGKLVNLQAYEGDISVGEVQGAEATEIASVLAGKGKRKGLAISIGTGASFNSSFTFELTGGYLRTKAALANPGSAIKISGGELELFREAATTLISVGNIDIFDGGKVSCNGSFACSNVEVFAGGTLDLSNGKQGCTFTTLQFHKDSNFIDPHGIYLGAINFKGCNSANMGKGRVVRRNDVTETIAAI